MKCQVCCIIFLYFTPILLKYLMPILAPSSMPADLPDIYQKRPPVVRHVEVPYGYSPHGRGHGSADSPFHIPGQDDLRDPRGKRGKEVPPPTPSSASSSAPPGVSSRAVYGIGPAGISGSLVFGQNGEVAMPMGSGYAASVDSRRTLRVSGNEMGEIKTRLRRLVEELRELTEDLDVDVEVLRTRKVTIMSELASFRIYPGLEFFWGKEVEPKLEMIEGKEEMISVYHRLEEIKRMVGVSSLAQKERSALLQEKGTLRGRVKFLYDHYGSLKLLWRRLNIGEVNVRRRGTSGRVGRTMKGESRGREAERARKEMGFLEIGDAVESGDWQDPKTAEKLEPAGTGMSMAEAAAWERDYLDDQVENGMVDEDADTTNRYVAWIDAACKEREAANGWGLGGGEARYRDLHDLWRVRPLEYSQYERNMELEDEDFYRDRASDRLPLDDAEIYGMSEFELRIATILAEAQSALSSPWPRRARTREENIARVVRSEGVSRRVAEMRVADGEAIHAVADEICDRICAQRPRSFFRKVA